MTAGWPRSSSVREGSGVSNETARPTRHYPRTDLPRSSARPELMAQRLWYQCAPRAPRGEIFPSDGCRGWGHGDHQRMGGTAGWVQVICSSSTILIRLPGAAPGRAQPPAASDRRARRYGYRPARRRARARGMRRPR